MLLRYLGTQKPKIASFDLNAECCFNLFCQQTHRAH